MANIGLSGSDDPETYLWRTVVVQAFIDALEKRCTRDGTHKDRHEARRWLLHGGRDFTDVCHAAGLDPDAVRQEAQRRADAGWSVADHPDGRVRSQLMGRTAA